MTEPNLPDYQAFYDAFTPEILEAGFNGSMADGINACVECCDRHVDGDKTAIFWESANSESGRVSFAELQRDTERFASLLYHQGIRAGDCVSGLLPRTPELVTVILGTLRLGAVYQPLFTAFGPKAIEHRLTVSGSKLVVTDTANRPKLDEIPNCPMVATIGTAFGSDVDFRAEMAKQDGGFAPVLCKGDDPFLIMSTSGTTGAPKGMNVPLQALTAFDAYMRYGIDLRPDDRYWNIADPGWAYGLYYAVLGPLLMGNATLLVDGAFTVERTCEIIQKFNISNLAGAPTAYRMMIAAGDQVPNAIRGKLRVAASAGEPLNPEVMRWFADELDCPLHDQYGQTEMAMVLMNHHALNHEVKPGSAGLPMPGFTLCVLDEAGNPVPDGEPGILAVNRKQSSLWYFPGYLGREGQDWIGDYYLTGDSVERHADGSYAFVGRSDDLISSAGYRIGPFDVESCLIEHDSVLESAVVGKPDPERGQIVKAFVVLKDGVAPSDDLSEALRLHVRKRLGAHAYPREIAFVDELPKTPSGKIQRFLLRER